MRRFGVPVVATAVIVAGAAVAGLGRGADAAEAAIMCTNPASGINWQIMVDYDKRTVDSYPARVSDGEISWHDEKDGGTYTLDRASGKLTVVAASSTGGYFLFDRCKTGK